MRRPRHFSISGTLLNHLVPAPAAQVADALVLARPMKGVLMVVRHGKVDRTLAGTTLEHIRQAGASVVGVVLNDVPRDDEQVRPGSSYFDGRPGRSGPTGSTDLDA